MNEPTDFGPYNEALRRRYGVGGQSGPVLTLASDAFPIIGISEELEDPENQYLSGHANGFAGGTQAAVVGNLSMISLCNPASSGVICVLQRIVVLTTSTISLRVGDVLRVIATQSPVAVTAGFKRDARPVPTSWPRTTCGLQIHNDSTFIGTEVGVFTPLTTESVQLPIGNVVLPPASSIAVSNRGNNIALTAYFEWRERRAASHELP